MVHQRPKTAAKKWPLEALRVLDSCQHIHRHAEEFYLALAELHRDQGDVARIWGLLAIDKCNHADAFKMANRLKGEGIRDIRLSDDLAAQILGKMKSVARTRLTLSVVEALRFAIKMEEKLENVHFRNVVQLRHEQDMELMASTLKSSSAILHLLTEEYVNLTLLD